MRSTPASCPKSAWNGLPDDISSPTLSSPLLPAESRCWNVMTPSTRNRPNSKMPVDATPAVLGYRMPAEWEPHAATWLAWPHNREDWPGKFEPIPWVYAEIIRNLARHERVELVVKDAASKRKVRMLLDRAGVSLKNVFFHCWPTDRVWLRDSGCIFVRRDSEMAAANFRFNAWAKYSNWRK